MSIANRKAVGSAPNSDSSTDRFQRCFAISALFALLVGLVYFAYLVKGNPPVYPIPPIYLVKVAPTVSRTGVSNGLVLLVTITALAGFFRFGLKFWPWKINKEMLSAHLGKLLKSIKSRTITKEDLKKEMKTITDAVQSIEKQLREELQQLSEVMHEELQRVKSELQQKNRLWAELQQLLKLMRQETNEVKTKEQINTAIEIIESIGNQLMSSQEINRDQVNQEIREAMEAFQSLKEHLIQLVKSENINKEDDEKIQVAMQSAIQAVKSMNNIMINFGHL